MLFSGCAQQSVGGATQMTSNEVSQAVINGDISRIDQLLKEGNSIEGLSSDELTPLMWAAKRGQLKSAQFLIDKGANIDARNKIGHTALALAYLNDQWIIASDLLQKGANVNKTIAGLYDLRTFCVRHNNTQCVVKIDETVGTLSKMKSSGEREYKAETTTRDRRIALRSRKVQPNLSKIPQDTQQNKTKEQELQEEVDKLAAVNDLKGLKDYTEKNPNAVYYIKDEWLRLALTGPKGMKVGDIREYLKSGKSEKIIVAMIKQQETPYKKFSMPEVDMLLKMELSENVITAMIDVTTKLMDNAKIAKQQQFFLDEQKRIADQQTAAVYQSSTAQTDDTQNSSVTDKVQNEMIKQGVGLLLDQLFK